MSNVYDYTRKVITYAEAADILGFKNQESMGTSLRQRGIHLPELSKWQRRYFSFCDIKDIANQIGRHYEIPDEFKPRFLVDSKDTEEAYKVKESVEISTLDSSGTYIRSKGDWYDTADKLAWLLGVDVDSFLDMVLNEYKEHLVERMRG